MKSIRTLIKSPRRLAISGIGAVFAVLVIATSGTVAVAATDDEVTSMQMATLLRSARAVISDSQKLINDASKGDKGLSGDVVVGRAKVNFKKATNIDISTIDAASLRGQLLTAELDAIKEVMDEAQERINKKGVGLKGFLPAIFAKAVADKFREKKGSVADIKLTAPKNYVRNRANRPDKWEHNIIESKFKSGSHPKGAHVAEMAQKKGKNAFRLILPEYYKQSCLGCHGGPKGERDITGGKKEGGKLGELGGAISVTLFK